MIRYWFAASAALLITLPAQGVAQERGVEPGRARPRVRAWSTPEGGEVTRYFMARPRIGVSVSTEADAETDKIGARIVEVTPDGPADQAGLRKDDIITRFDGTRLAGDAPGHKLVELAQQLESGDTVKVEYRRGTANRNASIVARELGGMAFTLPRMRVEQMMPALEGLRSSVMFLGNWPGLKLAELNPGLGEYFGTNEGMLVLEAPSDSSLPLRAGDVIVSIDGRAPQSMSHAMRIMSSYAPGEDVKFDIMRQRQRQSVTWKVSERRSGTHEFRSMHPTPLERPRVKVQEEGRARS